MVHHHTDLVTDPRPDQRPSTDRTGSEARPQAEDLWPFTGLRVVSDQLELRYIDDGLLFPLARLAAEGIHEPEAMPFLVPWTRGTPVEVARSVLTYLWGARAGALGPDLRLELAVVRDGEVLGVQALHGREFAITRTSGTGSWLGLRHQGQGIGTAMRRMVLHLLFEGFGAVEATTSAFADNAASNAVTRRIGYEPDGTAVVAREGVSAVENRYRLTRAAWEAQTDRPDVELHGVEPVTALLGL